MRQRIVFASLQNLWLGSSSGKMATVRRVVTPAEPTMQIAPRALLFLVAGTTGASDWTVIEDSMVVAAKQSSVGSGWNVGDEAGVLTVSIPGEILEIKDSAIFERLVILVGRDQHSDVAAIVDLDDGRLVDQFRGRSMALSPTGRLVVYEHYFPPHGMRESRSNVTIVYDASRSPEGNRLGHANIPVCSSYNPAVEAGTPVYPHRNTDPAGYSAWVDDEQQRIQIHRDAGYAWSPDGERVAFAVSQGGDDFLVVIELPSGAENSRTLEVPLKSLSKTASERALTAPLMRIKLGMDRSAKLVAQDGVLLIAPIGE